MEEHLNTDRGLAVIFTQMQLNRQRRKQDAEKHRVNAAEGGQEDDGENAEVENEPAVQSKAERESREKQLMEERLSKRVELMFTTMPYRKELTLEDLQLKLLQIQHTPRDELEKWIDIFEVHWGIEKAKNADELRHLAALFDIASEDPGKQDEYGNMVREKQSEEHPAGGYGTQVDPKIIAKELRRQNGEPKPLRSIADERKDHEGAAEMDSAEVDLRKLPNDDRWLLMALSLGFKQSSIPLPMLLPALDMYFARFRKSKKQELEKIAEERQKVMNAFAEDGIELPSDEQLQIFAKQHGVDLLPSLVEVRGAPQAKKKARS